MSTILTPREKGQTAYEATKELLDGLDDLLAMRSTLKCSELGASSDMIATYVTTVVVSTQRSEEHMSESQQIKMVKQVTQSRSTMIECRLDTSSMDQIVESTMLALKSRLARVVEMDFLTVSTRLLSGSRSKS